MADVVDFPGAPSEDDSWLVGPFEEWRVIVEGRMIPRLTGFCEGDQIVLIVDRRFSVAFPRALAKSAAWLIANALAVGEGYSHLGAESKHMPFAPRACELASVEPRPEPDGAA